MGVSPQCVLKILMAEVDGKSLCVVAAIIRGRSRAGSGQDRHCCATGVERRLVICSPLDLRDPRSSRPVVRSAHVVVDAEQLLKETSVADRVTVEAGDFFRSVPSGGDAYVLSHILDHWNDDQCLTILGHCRKAMKPHSRLLIVESVTAVRFNIAFSLLCLRRRTWRFAGRKPAPRVGPSQTSYWGILES